ncbi:hypothetical protein E8F20_02740 [Pseudomonas sp. BN415]|uniref:hypothetical protein n=1 Tax=Pseudomonas sp. BN415 TaxID=2567889 RepID=UPI0024583166|nr:hypothetical protein [Pseudomonas sp. BN415]MDH4580789.1 hypothetical protein [Pseudomonas sp. BN415]
MTAMDFFAFVGSTIAASALSILALSYLSKRLVDHRLAKDLKDYDAEVGERLALHKAELDRIVNEAKAESDARLKKELEVYLGDQSAERNYRAEARKRLYLAVGPLRFQLLLAATELANRVTRISDSGTHYDMSIHRYFGQSTAYRILRVLAISELVERQIAFADFTVDPAMRALLKFKRQAFMSLSSDRVSLGHPQEDWTRQQQHVFYDVLGTIASRLITHDSRGGPDRILTLDEFSEMLEKPDEARRLEPIPRLIDGFSVTERPILWLRLLALSQLCMGLLETQGAEMGLEFEKLDVDALLKGISDDHIRDNCAAYSTVLQGFRTSLTWQPPNTPVA